MKRWLTVREWLGHLLKQADGDTLPTQLKDAGLPEGAKGIRKAATPEVKEVEEDDDGIVLDFIDSTAAVDRDNDILDVEGWDLDNYKKNPVFLWAHDYKLPPIGMTLDIKVDDGALRARRRFTPKDLNPFGDMIGRMYQKGFMSAVSVGFLPKEWSFNEERGFLAIDYQRQELLETSGVPVPANPEALLQASKSGIDVSPMRAWAERVLQEGNAPMEREALERIVKSLDPKGRLTVGPGSGSTPAKQPAQPAKQAPDSDEEELSMLGLSEKATEALKRLVKEHGTKAVSAALEDQEQAAKALKLVEPEDPADPPAEPEPKGADSDGDEAATIVDAEGKELSEEQVQEVVTSTIRSELRETEREVTGRVE